MWLFLRLSLAWKQACMKNIRDGKKYLWGRVAKFWETYHQALHFWGDGFSVMTKILSRPPTFKCWKSSTWCFESHLQLGDTVLKLALLSKLLFFNPKRSFHVSNNTFHNLSPHSAKFNWFSLCYWYWCNSIHNISNI